MPRHSFHTLLPLFTMTIETIIDPADARIRAYGNLKDKQLAQDFGLFVVEGEHLVRRLLASNLSPHSVLMTESRYASGSEANGLAERWCARADQEVTISMALETDSLNVGVAAGIFMYHYQER